MATQRAPKPDPLAGIDVDSIFESPEFQADLQQLTSSMTGGEGEEGGEGGLDAPPPPPAILHKPTALAPARPKGILQRTGEALGVGELGAARGGGAGLVQRGVESGLSALQQLEDFLYKKAPGPMGDRGLLAPGKAIQRGLGEILATIPGLSEDLDLHRNPQTGEVDQSALAKIVGKYTKYLNVLTGPVALGGKALQALGGKDTGEALEAGAQRLHEGALDTASDPTNALALPTGAVAAFLPGMAKGAVEAGAGVWDEWKRNGFKLNKEWGARLAEVGLAGAFLFVGGQSARHHLAPEFRRTAAQQLAEIQRKAGAVSDTPPGPPPKLAELTPERPAEIPRNPTLEPVPDDELGIAPEDAVPEPPLSLRGVEPGSAEEADILRFGDEGRAGGEPATIPKELPEGFEAPDPTVPDPTQPPQPLQPELPGDTGPATNSPDAFQQLEAQGVVIPGSKRGLKVVKRDAAVPDETLQADLSLAQRLGPIVAQAYHHIGQAAKRVGLPVPELAGFLSGRGEYLGTRIGGEAGTGGPGRVYLNLGGFTRGGTGIPSKQRAAEIVKTVVEEMAHAVDHTHGEAFENARKTLDAELGKAGQMGVGLTRDHLTGALQQAIEDARKAPAPVSAAPAPAPAAPSRAPSQAGAAETRVLGDILGALERDLSAAEQGAKGLRGSATPEARKAAWGGVQRLRKRLEQLRTLQDKVTQAQTLPAGEREHATSLALKRAAGKLERTGAPAAMVERLAAAAAALNVRGRAATSKPRGRPPGPQDPKTHKALRTAAEKAPPASAEGAPSPAAAPSVPDTPPGPPAALEAPQAAVDYFVDPATMKTRLQDLRVRLAELREAAEANPGDKSIEGDLAQTEAQLVELRRALDRRARPQPEAPAPPAPQTPGVTRVAGPAAGRVAQLEQQLRFVEGELASPKLSPEKRDKMEARRGELLAEIDFLKEQAAGLAKHNQARLDEQADRNRRGATAKSRKGPRRTRATDLDEAPIDMTDEPPGPPEDLVPGNFGPGAEEGPLADPSSAAEQPSAASPEAARTFDVNENGVPFWRLPSGAQQTFGPNERAVSRWRLLDAPLDPRLIPDPRGTTKEHNGRTYRLFWDVPGHTPDPAKGWVEPGSAAEANMARGLEAAPEGHPLQRPGEGGPELLPEDSAVLALDPDTNQPPLSNDQLLARGPRRGKDGVIYLSAGPNPALVPQWAAGWAQLKSLAGAAREAATEYLGTQEERLSLLLDDKAGAPANRSRGEHAYRLNLAKQIKAGAIGEDVAVDLGGRLANEDLWQLFMKGRVPKRWAASLSTWGRRTALFPEALRRQFGITRKQGVALFKAAEAVRELDQDGNPVFGTSDRVPAPPRAAWRRDKTTGLIYAVDPVTGQVGLVEPRLRVMLNMDGSFKQRTRYTPDEGRQLWLNLTDHEEKVVRWWLQERELLRQKLDVAGFVEGYMHHFWEGQLKGSAVPGLGDIHASTRTAPAERFRKGAEGYSEDFELSVAKYAVTTARTKLYNKFIRHWVKTVTKPYNPEAGIGLQPDHRVVPALEFTRGAHLRGKLGATRQVHTQLYDDYMRFVERADTANAALSMVADLGHYMQANLLMSPSSPANNFVSGGIQYATGILDHFWKASIEGVAAGLGHGDAREAGLEAKRFFYSILAPFDALRPSTIDQLSPAILGADKGNLAATLARREGRLAQVQQALLLPFGAVENYWKRALASAELRAQGLPVDRQAIMGSLQAMRALNKTIDTYAFDYNNTSQLISRWKADAVGAHILPFPSYAYKIGRFYMRYLVEPFFMLRSNPTEAIARVLTAGTILAAIGIPTSQTDPGQDPEKVAAGEGVGNYYPRMAVSVDRTGRIYIGKRQKEGREVQQFLRTAKYPWFFLHNIINQGGDVVQEFLSTGPLLELAASAFGKTSKYDLYKPGGVRTAELLEPYLPFSRTYQELRKVASKEKRLSTTFGESLGYLSDLGSLIGAPAPPEGQDPDQLHGMEAVRNELTPRAPSKAQIDRWTMQPVEYDQLIEALKFLFGVNIKEIDPQQYAQERAKVAAEGGF